MSIFPKIKEITYQSRTDPGIEDKISFEYDFKKGDFAITAGRTKKIKSQDRIRIWIHKLLLTELGKYPIYEDTTYGMKFYSWFFGMRDRDFIKVELEEEVRKKMNEHPEILRMYNVDISFGRNDCLMKYTVDTVYGKIENGQVIISAAA